MGLRIISTLLELFKNKDSFKYGTIYSDVKSDTETLVEQEQQAIRKNFTC